MGFHAGKAGTQAGDQPVQPILQPANARQCVQPEGKLRIECIAQRGVDGSRAAMATTAGFDSPGCRRALLLRHASLTPGHLILARADRHAVLTVPAFNQLGRPAAEASIAIVQKD